MVERMKLNQVIPNWKSSGIFSKLNSHNVPWKTEVQASLLDLQYHGNHSGQKKIAPLVDSLLTDGILTDVDLTTLASIIYGMYSVQWTKLYATLKAQYNPIENYRMIETESISGTESATIANTTTGKTTTSNQVDTSNSTHGFNSTTAQPTDESMVVSDGETDDESTSSGTTSGENSTDRTLTRSGNIGVTTSQQMIESERNLWMWNFFDVVFSDIDKVLTLGVY